MFSEYRHIISFLYSYLYVLIHYQVFLNLLYWEFRFDIFKFEKGSYVQVILLFALFLLIVPYSVYQWLYLKKIRQNRRLLSVLFLILFILIETVLIYLQRKTDYQHIEYYLLFIGSGVGLAFVMGWLLDILMKRLFTEQIN